MSMNKTLLSIGITCALFGNAFAATPHLHASKPLTQHVLQQETNNKIASSAFNYKQGIDVSINPRTGQANVNLPLAQLTGTTGMGYAVNLIHQQYNTNTRYVINPNEPSWTLGLPYIAINGDDSSGTLHLGSGGSYAFTCQGTACTLPLYKLQNIQLQKVNNVANPFPGGSSIAYVLTALSGTKTYFDTNGNIVFQENALGQKLFFATTPGNISGQPIASIQYITNNQADIGSTPSASEHTLTFDTAGDTFHLHTSSGISGDDAAKTYTVTSNPNLITITAPKTANETQAQTTTIQLTQNQDGSGTHINAVIYPTGLQQQFGQRVQGPPTPLNQSQNYYYYHQSNLSGANITLASSDTLVVKPNATNINQNFANGGYFYVGNPNFCSLQNEQQDCLVQNNNFYNAFYSVASIQPSPASNPGTTPYLATVKTYNHFHLLVNEETVGLATNDASTYQQGTLISSNDTWYAGQTLPSLSALADYLTGKTTKTAFNQYLPNDGNNQIKAYSQAPANYQSPVMQLSVLTKNGHKRVMVTTTQYNDFGQTTQVTKYELVDGQFKKIDEQVSTYDNPTAVSSTSTQYGVLLTSINTVYDPKTGHAIKTTETKNTPDTTFRNLIMSSTQSVLNYDAQGKPLSSAVVLSETQTTYAPAMIDGKANPFVGKPETQTVTKHYGTMTKMAETQTSYQFADNVTISNDLFSDGSWQANGIQRTFSKLMEITSTNSVNGVPQSRSITYVDPATGNTVKTVSQVVEGSITASPLTWITMSDNTSAYDVKGRVISQTDHFTGKALYVVYDDTNHTVTEYGDTKGSKSGGKKLAATPSNDVATTPIKKIQFNEFGQPVTTYSNANPGFINAHIHTGTLTATDNPDNGNYGSTLHEISHVTYNPNTGMKDAVETFAIPASSALLQTATPTQLTNTTYQYDQFGRVLHTDTTCNGTSCPGTNSTGVTTQYTYQDTYMQPTVSGTLSNKGKVTTTTTYQGGTASGVDLAQSQVKNNLGEVLTQSVTPVNQTTLQATASGMDIPTSGVSTTKTYNNLGQVTEQDVYHNGILAQTTHYTYDPIYGSVNITNVTDLGNELPSTDQHQATLSTDTFHDINGKTIATLTTMTNAYGKNQTTYYLSPLHIYDSSIPGDPLVETLPFNSDVAQKTAKLVGNTSFTQISNDWLKAAASACPSSSATNATFDCKHQVKFDYDTLNLNTADGKQAIVHAGLLNQEQFWGGTDYWYFYGQITGTRTTSNGSLNIWYPVKTDSCYTVAPASGGAAPAPLQNCGQSFPASAFTYSPYTNPVTASTPESGGHVHWTYNNKGKVTAIIGEVPTDNAEHMIPGPIAYAYNNEDQLTSITYPGFPHATGAAAVPHSMYYSYDNHGNESQVQDYAGNVTTYTYQQGTGGKWLIASATQNDPTGKFIGSVAYQYFNNNATLNKCVNATGLPSTALGPNGEKCAEFTSYTYTPDTGEVKTIDNAFVNYQPDGNTLMPTRTLNLSYTYFLDGNMKSKTLSANFNLQDPSDLTKPTSYTKDYSYILDKLYGVKVASSQNASFLPAPGTNTLSYQYSAAGNLLQAPHYSEQGGAPNGVDKMTYNDVNQISSYVPGGSSSN